MKRPGPSLLHDPARSRWAGALALVTALWLSACTGPTPQPDGSAQRPAAPALSAPAPSQARTARDYRQDAARHLYKLQSSRIYAGRLPPMLMAVGVLNVDIGQRGQVLGMAWMRAPRHAPEVMAEIERMVQAAAPYPAPVHLSRVTYTDVWLWHKSGQFQLDTLTEGQD